MTYKETIKLLVQIFFSFLKIAPVTFGGGYAMIPVIEKEVVVRRKWTDRHDMHTVISIAGSAPGGIAVNTASLIGYRLLGVKGAITAVIGVTLPPFLIILILGSSFYYFKDYPKVMAALEGIRAGIIALILLAAFKMGKKALFDMTTWIAFAGSIFALWVVGLHPIFIIVIGLLAGILTLTIKKKLGLPFQFQSTRERRKQKKKNPENYKGEGI